MLNDSQWLRQTVRCCRAAVVKSCTTSAITPVAVTPGAGTGLTPGILAGLGLPPTSGPTPVPSGAFQVRPVAAAQYALLSS